MYGNNWDIPGFRWYDKESQSSILCKLPGSVRAIQHRISAGRTGLLRGGSSYTNMFDGDARLALFTLSALGRDRLFENVRGLGFLILFALNPWRIGKVLFLSLWTWILYVAKRLTALVRPSTPHFTFLGPLLEIFNNIIFREITTFSVMVDIYRGMPAIYAAYTGYDEIAHHFGADSREAFQALRGIDQQIRQIDRIRRLYESPGYDLYILSDHGMTPSIPFRRAFGQSLEQWIADYTGRRIDEPAIEGEDEGLSEARVYYLLEEIRGLEQRSHRRMTGRILQATRQELERRLVARAQEADWDLSRRGDLAVRDSGSLSHVYFNVSPAPLDLSEVGLLHPGILKALVEHPGIGLVVGRQNGETLVLGAGGSLRLGPETQYVEGKNPLGGFDNPGWAASQIARLASFPHAGDLILLGAWDGQQVVSFEEQVASHGGLGGPQVRPFIAFPPGEGLVPRRIDNAEELHSLFDGYGQPAPGDEQHTQQA
jgi:hypothetical protein